MKKKKGQTPAPSTPSKRKRTWKVLRTGLLVCLVLFGFSATAVTYLWKSGKLFPWIRNQVIKLYIKKVAPQLPFQIEKIDLDGEWNEILQGKLSRVEFWLKWKNWRARIQGPLQVSRNAIKRNISMDYWPNITLEEVSIPSVSRSPIFPFHLSLEGSQNLKQLNQFSLQLLVPNFDWTWTGVHLQNMKLDSQWKEGSRAKVDLEIKSTEWKGPKPSATADSEDAANLGPIAFHADSPLILKNPIQIGPQIHFDLTAQGAELLLKGTYFDLPLKALPIQGQILLEKDPDFRIRVGSDLKKQILVSGRVHPDSGTNPSLEIKWSTSPWTVSELLGAALNVTQAAGGSFSQLSKLQKIDFKSGTIQTHGELSTPLQNLNFNSSKTLLKGSLDVKNLSLRWPKKFLAIREFNLNLPFSTLETARGNISIDQIYFRHFKAKLDPTDITLAPHRTPSGTRLWLRVAGDGGTSQRIPFIVDGIPFHLGKLTGIIKPTQILLNTSFQMKRLGVERILNDLCMGELPVPPTSISANFPKIEITPDSFDLTGDFHAFVFEGVIDIDEIGIFDLRNEVPEMDFNLDFRGIRLDRLGEWTGLGYMDGVVEGYAHDVVFQSWLPTQYVFSIDAKPMKHSAVVFSPEAMKKFIQVFAGDNLKALPGIADWYAFGLPRKLLGGYDLDYLGLTLISSEGRILMETHDPPEALKRDPKKHYLLSGKNMKMPLRSTHYPLVVDAISMSEFVLGMGRRFGNLNRETAEQDTATLKLKKEKKNEKKANCQPPDF